MNKIKIAPSLLAADFSILAQEIKKVEAAGCDWIHIDVMDGHFVPNLTVGPFIVKSIRKITNLYLDTHLMIENPQKFIPSFAQAGSDGITVHAEACSDNLRQTLEQIKSLQLKCGVSLKPASSLDLIDSILDIADLALMMTVNPGFGGQAFMPEVLPKIQLLRKKFSGDIEVDGGINSKTSKEAVRAGANVLVAGTAIFGADNAARAIQEMRQHD